MNNTYYKYKKYKKLYKLIAGMDNVSNIHNTLLMPKLQRQCAMSQQDNTNLRIYIDKNFFFGDVLSEYEIKQQINLYPNLNETLDNSIIGTELISGDDMKTINIINEKIQIYTLIISLSIENDMSIINFETYLNNLPRTVNKNKLELETLYIHFPEDREKEIKLNDNNWRVDNINTLPSREYMSKNSDIMTKIEKTQELIPLYNYIKNLRNRSYGNIFKSLKNMDLYMVNSVKDMRNITDTDLELINIDDKFKEKNIDEKKHLVIKKSYSKFDLIHFADITHDHCTNIYRLKWIFV